MPSSRFRFTMYSSSVIVYTFPSHNIDFILQHKCLQDNILQPVFDQYFIKSVYEVDVPDERYMEEDEDILNYDDLDDPDTFV